MKHIVAMGMDLGSAKTGMTIFHITKRGDELVAATTAEVDVMTTHTAETARRKKARAKGKKVSPRRKPAVSTIHADVSRCWDMVALIRAVLDEHKPQGIFIEMPGGGAQRARSARLMGGSTFMISTMLQYEDIPFEMYSPTDAEKSVGIFVSAKEVKAKGYSPNQAKAWKKERSKKEACSEWPLFEGWPETEGRAEDTFDSAVAFMCGRNANNLYAKLRSKLDGD